MVRPIGKGAFGEVFEAKHVDGGTRVAAKLESIASNLHTLQEEADILKRLGGREGGRDGVPHIFEYTPRISGYNVLIIDLFGSSLDNHLNLSDAKRFTVRTVFMLAQDLIKRIEFIHSKGVLHRDIKPENLVMGLGRRAHKVMLIDFGLAKRFTTNSGQHIPRKANKSFCGTPRYASLWTHQGLEQSRRDDLESLGYVLLKMLFGVLPWQGLRATSGKQASKQLSYQRIYDKKKNLSAKHMCKDFPPFVQYVFETYFGICRNLEFEETPPYTELHGLFSRYIEHDGVFTEGVTPLSESARYDTEHTGEWSTTAARSDTSIVSSGLRSLSNQARGGCVTMADLDARLREMHIEQGVSMTAFREVIRDKGYCLKNCHPYGSPKELQKVLRKSPKLLVKKEQAKQYEYVKKCLIVV